LLEIKIPFLPLLNKIKYENIPFEKLIDEIKIRDAVYDSDIEAF
jgi:hypothetical protein